MDNGTKTPAHHATLPADPGTSPEYKVFSSLLIIMVCVLGIIGNGVVIMVVAITKHQQTPTNYHLMSLAVADLMVLTAAGMPAATSSVFGYWVYGRYGCAILTYFQYLGINTSSAFIAVITIERYITICHPLKAQTLCTIPRTKKFIAVTWTVTCLYCTMWLYLADLEEVASANGTYVVCGYRVKRNSYMPIYFVDFGVFYVVPLLLATILYGLIAKAHYGNPLPIDLMNQNREAENKEGESCDPGNPEAGGEARQANSAAASRRQVTKMIAVVVILFALFWMPYRTLVVVNSFLSKPYVERGFLLFCHICIYLNSAINPIIYNAMSLKFRAAIWKLLHCDLSAQGNQEAALASKPDQRVLLVGSTDRATTELDEYSATNCPLLANEVQAIDGEAAATGE